MNKIELNQKIGRIIGTISIKLEGLFTGELYDVGCEASSVLWDLYYFVFGRTLPKPLERGRGR